MIGGRVVAGRASDTEADAIEVAGMQMGPHRLQPVVAVVAAAELDAQLAEVQSISSWTMTT